MLVSSFNLTQSFKYAPYLFCKKRRFKSEIKCFCIWTLTSRPPNWFRAETKIGGKMAAPTAWVLHRERKPGSWAGTLPRLSRCPYIM